ncbi:MAG: GNAT family N-acetyltransferase [Lachnospiraceae bacterium]|nr:GNAT family N-acetyltransferase [Lachnospiraceae bacterium]
MIIQVENNKEKEMISRTILEALPDWFGLPEAREEYIVNSVNQQFFAAVKEEKTIGFLCLKQTGKDTVEVSVMGVLKEFHRHGIGRKLFMKAREKAIKDGFSFIQVKTVQMGQYDNYDNTNKFYTSLGFKEFEIFPTLWDEWNPCQVYVMALL